MNLQQLRYVVAVAECGTMTRAARTLHVGQPALTQSIQALERELGATVFDRTSRGVVLTEVGRIIAASATRVLSELDDAASSVRSLADTDQHVLRFAMRPAAAREPGVALVALLREACPDLVVRVSSVDRVDDALDQVLAGEADFALTDLSGPVATGLVARRVGVHRFVALLPPGAHVDGPISWTALADYPLLGITRSDPRWRAADASFLSAGSTPDVVVEINQRDLVLPLVAAGVGATVGYEFQRDEADRLGITCVPLEPDATRAVELVRQRRALPAHAERCWELITSADGGHSLI